MAQAYSAIATAREGVEMVGSSRKEAESSSQKFLSSRGDSNLVQRKCMSPKLPCSAQRFLHFYEVSHSRFRLSKRPSCGLVERPTGTYQQQLSDLGLRRVSSFA